MTIKSFSMPDLGEGIHEAEVLSVLVEKGAGVKEGEVILEVETDKAAVEIPSPFSGSVVEILVGPGDIVQVGEQMIVFEVDAGLEALETKPGADTGAPETEVVPDRADRKTQVPASPATRRLARELGVDLHSVNPTGSGGIVLADDIRKAAEGAAEQPEEEAVVDPSAPFGIKEQEPFRLPDFSAWGEIEKQPFRSIRRATAALMTRSWSQIPHVTCQDTVDITRLEEFRQKHAAEIEAEGGKLSMTVFALKAVATALKNFPLFNSTLDLEAQEIIIKHYFHIGVAVDTEHGLMVPVIRDVDRKSIKEVAIELHELVNKARERGVSRDELLGGTFTITNAGAMGGGFFSPIINYPEVAILGLGQGRMQPAVVTDKNGTHEIVPRLIMPIVLSFDHRVVDGGDAIRFLKVIIDSLGDPDELLITMI